MKLPDVPLLSADAPMMTAWRTVHSKVNQVAGGVAAGFDGALTSPPTAGTWAQGDYVRKSNPIEAGSAGAKYIIKGWVRVTNGFGNILNTDWFEDRALTGN